VRRDLHLDADEDGVVDSRPERIEIVAARGIEHRNRLVLGRDARGRLRVHAREDGALELVERRRKRFGRSIVEACRNHLRLGQPADEGAAVLGDLVRDDGKDRDGAEGDREPRGDAEPAGARQARNRPARGARERCSRRAVLMAQLFQRRYEHPSPPSDAWCVSPWPGDVCRWAVRDARPPHSP
jgi:hypothetical protein